MKYRPAYLALLLLAACNYRYTAMNDPDFQKISVGTPIANVEKIYGEPNALHHKDDRYIYEYVTTDYNGIDPVRKIRYIFIVKDGVIKEKHTTMRDGPAFDLLVDPSPP